MPAQTTNPLPPSCQVRFSLCNGTWAVRPKTEAGINTEQGTADFDKVFVSWGVDAGAVASFSDGRVRRRLRASVADDHHRHTEKTGTRRKTVFWKSLRAPLDNHVPQVNDAETMRGLHNFIVKKAETITYRRKAAARAMD